jgi:hypothetical protein
MALGSLALSDTNVGFDAQGTAVMPITAGKETVGTIKLKSPFEMFKETFTSMKESLLNMVNLQSQEQKDANFIGAMQPNDDLEGVDTDDKTYGNFVEKAQTKGTEILDGIKEAFDNVSFGEKMMTLVLAGGFFIFTKYKASLTKALTPIVQFVKDAIKVLGPEGAFAAFLGGFVLLKSGLAKKGLMKAGGFILKTIKASAASLDRQGGLFKAMGNGFEKINRGVGSLVGGLKKTGSFITTNLTKGFNKLGGGIEAMNRGVAKAGGAIKGGFTKLLGLISKGFVAMKVGMTSMLSSLGPIIAPLLPIIAIAAAVAAIFFSLKSGFDTFKESLENGDSMFTAVLKGLGDAMLTLVTLPATLVKKLVGFIAGLFGFDNFKEKLESFSIKDQIIKSFKSLMGGMGRIIKAIAKGAGAALAAALPGGKTPQEEFARAYKEVMEGGQGEASIEGTPDFQGDQSQAEFNREEATFGSMAEVVDIQADNKVGDASAAESFYAQKRKEDKFDREYLASLPKMMSDTMKQFHLERRKELMANLDKKMEQAEVIKNADGSTSKKYSESGTYVIKGGNVQGDTINQMSNTQVTGDLGVNHDEATQKILQEQTF